MKRNIFYKAIYTLIAITLLVSCSRKKDKFLNRSFHSVTTKYNILYNGDVAFEAGKQGLIESFNDNYWEILPVERLQISDDFILPGASKNSNFERAEEKAVKAIQKHGMNISGKEKNPQTDEAYLLLGKARYFDQRLIPSLEAFNYILYKYPSSDKINHARIWREKVNLRLENTDLAIRNLKRLIETEKLENEDITDAHAMLAQAYINNKHLDSAITHIKVAVDYSKDKEVKGRLSYMKGQIYNRLGYKDSANMAFDDVIGLKRRTLWIYHVNAHVEKARNFDFQNGNKLEYKAYIDKLEKNRENKPYLDKIYNLHANFYKNEGIDSLAEVHFNKSIKASTSDKYLQSLNYRALAEYRFDAAEFKQAGMYYDSTMGKLKINSREYRRFKKKRENLNDVILYEEQAKANDSILKIINYADDERLAYFEKHIEGLKQKEEEEKALEVAKLKAKQNNNLDLNPNVKVKKNANTEFYFYNPTTTAYGKTEFRKIWGDIPLEDNWRQSNKGINTAVADTTIVEKANGDKKDIYNPEYYLAQLPQSQKEIDSIVKKRNYAYYQLGLIYKQKFKEYPLAAKRLEKLLTFKPSERLELPAKYQLYKIYTELGDNDKEKIKADILSNYAESRYAEILRNPAASLSFSENSPEVIYKNLYIRFENQEYEDVLSDLEQYIPTLDGDELLAKYELLKALTSGRIDGFESYKTGLNYVALNYANTDEGKKAQALLQTSIPVFEKLTLVDNAAGKTFKLVYVLDRKNIEAVNKTEDNLNKALEDTSKKHLKVSKDFYTKDKMFVVVHGFITPELAYRFNDFLSEQKKKYKVSKEFKVISSENYKTIQVHKSLNQLQPPIN